MFLLLPSISFFAYLLALQQLELCYKEGLIFLLNSRKLQLLSFVNASSCRDNVGRGCPDEAVDKKKR